MHIQLADLHDSLRMRVGVSDILSVSRSDSTPFRVLKGVSPFLSSSSETLLFAACFSGLQSSTSTP